MANPAYTAKPIRLRDGSYQLPPFAIIDEHEFVDEETGKKQVFDKHRLQRLADKLNRRVKETGDLIPITLGHTVDGLPEHRQPPIVGFSRNFRLAPLKKSGRWAIWADPISDPRNVQKFRDHPRRSVELWAAKSAKGEDDIDPIAILGATSPKRDLGLHQFSRSGPAIRYLDPTDERIHYRKETGDDDMGEHEDGDGESKLSPSDVKAIVAELLQTEPMKKLLAVAEKMEAGDGADGDGVDGDGAAPGTTPELDGNPSPGQPGHQEEPLGAEPPPGSNPEEMDRDGEPRQMNAMGGMGGTDGGATGYSAVGSRSARMPYSRSRTPQRQSRTVPEYTGDWRQWLEDYENMNNANEAVQPVLEQVGRQDAELKRYKRELADTQKEVAALRRENVALEINGTLAELAKEFVLDEEEEFKELIRMSKPQRDARYDQIKRRYAKRGDETPGGGDYAIAGSEEAQLPTRMSRRQDSGPVNRFARSGEEASRIASEMARRGIQDPDEFYRKIAEEQAAVDARQAQTNGKIRTR